MNKAYILLRRIDLGDQIFGVYSSIEYIPYTLTPSKYFTFYGLPEQEEHISDTVWNVEEDDSLYVECFEIQGV